MNDQNKILSSAAAILLALVLTACQEAKSVAPTPLPVRAATVETIRGGNPVRYSATIVPYSQVDLSFKSNGYVERILQVTGADGRRRNVDQGDFVKRRHRTRARAPTGLYRQTGSGQGATLPLAGRVRKGKA